MQSFNMYNSSHHLTRLNIEFENCTANGNNARNKTKTIATQEIADLVISKYGYQNNNCCIMITVNAYSIKAVHFTYALHTGHNASACLRMVCIAFVHFNQLQNQIDN